MFKTCYRQGRLAVLFLTLLTLAGPAFAQNTTASDADFDGNGEVGLSDFLVLADDEVSPTHKLTISLNTKEVN